MPRCVWEGQSHTSPGSHPGGGTLPHRGSSAGLPAGSDVAAPSLPLASPKCCWQPQPGTRHPKPSTLAKTCLLHRLLELSKRYSLSKWKKKYPGQSGNPEEYQEKPGLEQTLPGLPSSQSSRSQGFCKQGKGKTSKEAPHPVLVPRGE